MFIDYKNMQKTSPVRGKKKNQCPENKDKTRIIMNKLISPCLSLKINSKWKKSQIYF